MINQIIQRSDLIQWCPSSWGDKQIFTPEMSGSNSLGTTVHLSSDLMWKPVTF